MAQKLSCDILSWSSLVVMGRALKIWAQAEPEIPDQAEAELKPFWKSQIRVLTNNIESKNGGLKSNQ